MFVRRKLNKSGSISVYVVDKSRGRYAVVKSFGTVRSALEADLLENKAREFVREQMGEPETLFGGMPESQLREYAAMLEQGRIELAGPELFFGELFDRLGLGLREDAAAGDDSLFRHLVICRLFDPGSKLRVADYLRRYLCTEVDAAQIYRFTDHLFPADLRLPGDPVSGESPPETSACCFLTELSFESAKTADGEPSGKTRSRKLRSPQLFFGILVADDGRPLGCRLFEGRRLTADKLITFLRRFGKRHGISQPMLVVPAGLLSRRPARQLEKSGYAVAVADRSAGERWRRELDRIGTAFRMNRRDLQIRPYHRRLKGRVEGHLCICLAAYAVQFELERLLAGAGLEITPRQVRDAAARLFRLNYISSYTRRPKSVLVQMDAIQKRIFDLVHS